MDEELPRLLEASQNGAVRLVPVPVRASPLKGMPLAETQWVKDPALPLDQMSKSKREHALVEVVYEVLGAFGDTAPTAPTRSQRISIDPFAAHPRAAALQPTVSRTPPSTGALGPVRGVPAQRPNYRRRSTYFDSLARQVLGIERRTVGITGEAPGSEVTRVGLHGMGGIGKTVLAIDLTRDAHIRRAFPDGVFWLTFGQTPDVRALQDELARFVGGDMASLESAGERRDRLRGLFEDKTCLLVLDDVWRAGDAEPFGVLGPHGRLLITTRDADLLVALDARELPLDVLDTDGALDLLADWSEEARDNMPQAASEVAAHCGYLPLAIALAGARIRGGGRWEDVASALKAGRIEFLERPYGSVFSSLRLSTSALPDDEADRYAELTAFPEDAQIPVRTISTLWRHTGGLDEIATRTLLTQFARKALLTIDDSGETIGFHDLQHDFLRLDVDSLAGAHATLVGAYCAVCGGAWHEVEDDGYVFERLPWHLREAGETAALQAILFDPRWMRSKLEAVGVNALIADYGLAPGNVEAERVAAALRLSAHALAHDPRRLAGQLVGRLTDEDGEAIAELRANARSRADPPAILPAHPILIPPGTGEIRRFEGHAGGVCALAVMADGRRAISGSGDRTVRVWDLETGAEIRRMEGHTDPVTALAVAADGRHAISGSRDRTLRLWDLETGAEVRRLEGHTDRVTALAVTADGRRAISGSRDRTVRLWDLETGAEIHRLKGHSAGIRALSATGDGRLAVSGSRDRTIRVWDLETGHEIGCLEGHSRGVTALAMIGEGERALSGAADDTLRLWDLEARAELERFEGHTGGIGALAVSGDGRLAVSGSYDQTLILWNLDSGRETHRFGGHTDIVSALAITSDGRRALSGSGDQTLRLWDLETSHQTQHFCGHKRRVTALAVARDGRLAVSGSYDRTLRLWDLQTGREVRRFGEPTGWVQALAVTDDGRRALSGSYDGILRFWDLKTGQEIRRLKGQRGGITALALTGDGRRALSGSDTRAVSLWDLENGQEIGRLKGHTDKITALALTSDSRRAFSSAHDRTLRLWDLETCEELLRLDGQSTGAFAVSSDGRLAVSASNDHSVCLWDLEISRRIGSFYGHTREVAALALTDDTRHALSCSFDQTIRIWDLETGNEIACLDCETDPSCVVITPNAARAVVGDSRGRVLVFDALTYTNAR